MLASVFIPGTVFAVPLYLLLSKTGLSRNTLFAVILPGLVNPFGVYLMRIYAEQAIPSELLDAARVDGAGELRIFATIAFPLDCPRFCHCPPLCLCRTVEQLLFAPACPEQKQFVSRYGGFDLLERTGVGRGQFAGALCDCCNRRGGGDSPCHAHLFVLAALLAERLGVGQHPVRSENL